MPDVGAQRGAGTDKTLPSDTAEESARLAAKHDAAPLRVRIGLNAGEPIAEDDPDGRADLFGAAVQLAKRVCDHARPGQILCSNVVRELAVGKGFDFADAGDVALKGFDAPVRLYEVVCSEEEPLVDA